MKLLKKGALINIKFSVSDMTMMKMINCHAPTQDGED
jgi:hypothetical protein